MWTLVRFYMFLFPVQATMARPAVSGHIYDSGGVLGWAVCWWSRLVHVCVYTCTLTFETREFMKWANGICRVTVYLLPRLCTRSKICLEKRMILVVGWSSNHLKSDLSCKFPGKVGEDVPRSRCTVGDWILQLIKLGKLNYKGALLRNSWIVVIR